MVVDTLLRTMLISVITPSSTSRSAPTEIIVVDIAINRKRESEAKDEEEEGILEGLHFDGDKSFDATMRAFAALLREANASTHSGKECTSKTTVKAWWQQRFRLDTALKAQLADIEESVLGVFRCLLIPHFRSKQSKMLIHSLCDALVTAINDYLARKTNGAYLPTCAVSKVGEEKEKSSKVLLFRKVLQRMVMGYAAQTENENELGDAEIERGVAHIFGVAQYGAHLVRKLAETVKQHTAAATKKYAAKLNLREMEPLILSLGDALTHIPWESVPVLLSLSCAPSVCRIPCLEFAALRVFELGSKANSKECPRQHFILNPKGDLVKTEQRFTRLLNDEWTGIKGVIPTAAQFRDGVENNDVFLYVGHNGGEEFVSCSVLATLSVRAITFLMGCSSGLLRKKGHFVAKGIANYYLVASCPIIVANLWDVTDKDIDQFSCQMLRKSVLKRGELVDVAKAVSESRAVCKLKYLNGAAPICYGIPYHLIHGVVV